MRSRKTKGRSAAGLTASQIIILKNAKAGPVRFFAGDRMGTRCAECRRWVCKGPYGWFKYGEFGTEEGFVCGRCLPNWTPTDGRGRGPEAGYCGVRT